MQLPAGDLEDHPVDRRAVERESRQTVARTVRDCRIRPFVELVPPETSGAEGLLLQISAEVMLETVREDEKAGGPHRRGMTAARW